LRTTFPRSSGSPTRGNASSTTCRPASRA
jgi:hypothetical protein